MLVFLFSFLTTTSLSILLINFFRLFIRFELLCNEKIINFGSRQPLPFPLASEEFRSHSLCWQCQIFFMIQLIMFGLDLQASYLCLKNKCGADFVICQLWCFHPDHNRLVRDKNKWQTGFGRFIVFCINEINFNSSRNVHAPMKWSTFK